MEVIAEGMADSRPNEEPPAPERAARDGGEMVTACLGQAPEDLPAAPAAHMPGATDTSGTLLASFASEGCISSCHVADGFGFFFQGVPGKEST